MTTKLVVSLLITIVIFGFDSYSNRNQDVRMLDKLEIPTLKNPKITHEVGQNLQKDSEMTDVTKTSSDGILSKDYELMEGVEPNGFDHASGLAGDYPRKVKVKA